MLFVLSTSEREPLNKKQHWIVERRVGKEKAVLLWSIECKFCGTIVLTNDQYCVSDNGQMCFKLRNASCLFNVTARHLLTGCIDNNDNVLI